MRLRSAATFCRSGLNSSYSRATTRSLGGEDGVLQVLELLGDVPLAVGQGLLADVVRGHLVVEGVADLDVVAEDLVVAHLQAADAGALLLPGLHLGDDRRAARLDLPEAVHLGVVARPG